MISLVSKSKAQKRDPEHVLRYSIDDNSNTTKSNRKMLVFTIML